VKTGGAVWPRTPVTASPVKALQISDAQTAPHLFPLDTGSGFAPRLSPRPARGLGGSSRPLVSPVVLLGLSEVVKGSVRIGVF